MAILANITDPRTKAPLKAYIRVSAIRLAYAADTPGAEPFGVAHVTLQAYSDRPSRLAGGQPIDVSAVAIRFGPNATPTVQLRGKSVMLPVSAAAEPTRTDLYTAVKTMPVYAGAEDA